MSNSTLATKILADLVSSYRAAHPRSRIVLILKLDLNTSARKSYCCALCGAQGPTFSARWPETVRSRKWCLAHMAEHVSAELERLADNVGAVGVAYAPQAVAP